MSFRQKYVLFLKTKYIDEKSIFNYEIPRRYFRLRRNDSAI